MESLPTRFRFLWKILTNVRLTKTTAANMRLASTTMDRLNVNARMASKVMASLAKVNSEEANQFIDSNESVRTND